MSSPVRRSATAISRQSLGSVQTPANAMLPKLAIVIAMSVALVPAFGSNAFADWLITPFIGTTFGGDDPFVDLELSSGTTKTIFGGSVAVLSRQVFGLEADFGDAPRFFDRSDKGGLVTTSNLFTLTGNVMLAVPLSVTRESLRPYAVAGGGLIRANSRDVIQFASLDRTLGAIDFGGGAIGMLSQRSGVRFELRQFRTLYAQDLLQGRREHLSFWRATVGVTLRY